MTTPPWPAESAAPATSAENLSNQQAVRDIRALSEAGLLEAVGNTKARYYVPGPDFPAVILEAVRQPIRLVDPYED